MPSRIPVRQATSAVRAASRVVATPSQPVSVPFDPYETPSPAAQLAESEGFPTPSPVGTTSGPPSRGGGAGPGINNIGGPGGGGGGPGGTGA
ncbi:hypothetical protein HDU87_006934, partial [Geranomyces variabilis]